jgi:hypothetical protein
MSDGSSHVDWTRLSVEQAAKILSEVFRDRVDIKNICLDLQNGAPVNGDGTIHLVNYAAWLAKEMGRGE